MLDFHLNKLGNDTTRLVRYVKIANSIVVNYLQRYKTVLSVAFFSPNRIYTQIDADL